MYLRPMRKELLLPFAHYIHHATPVACLYANGIGYFRQPARPANNNLHLAITAHMDVSRLVIIDIDHEAKAVLAVNRDDA